MSGKMDAVEKFWGCADYLEILLTMLDPLSIRRLTQSGVMDRKVLKKSLSSKVWARLIRRSRVLVLDDVKNFVAILKFMKMEDPGSFLLPLLHHICERFPVQAGRFPDADGVALNRPGHTEPRKVSLQGFLLLEEVESSFGTSIQSIEKIEEVTLDESHLSALSSRMMRQENPVASISIMVVSLGGGLQSAQAFSILLLTGLVLRGLTCTRQSERRSGGSWPRQ